MPSRPVLYLGDTALTGAACYLAGLMTRMGWGFDYVPSDQPVTNNLAEQPRELFILSDYPAAMMAPEAQDRVVEQVSRGAGLVMVGGWESFHGQGGNWDRTSLAEILPVKIQDTDDRVNCDQPVLVLSRNEHPVLQGLPWADRPPLIGGFNRVTPRPGSQVLLEAQTFTVQRRDDQFTFNPATRQSLLVVGQYGQGRTAALATDLAPHWIGPMVDWGNSRVTAKADGGIEIEVGDCYARFVEQLLKWVGRLGT